MICQSSFIVLLALLAPQDSSPSTSTSDAADPAEAAATAATAPLDLLRISKLEAERTRRLLLTKVSGLLDSLGSRSGSANRATTVQSLIQLGPDVVPVLLDVVADLDQNPKPGSDTRIRNATMALRSMYLANGNTSVLQRLAAQVGAGSETTATAILRGLTGVDHALIRQMATPLLKSTQSSVIDAAVSALAWQTKGNVASLLRPLLPTHVENQHTIVSALHSLKDPSSATEVASLMDRTQDDKLRLACIDYLSDLGSLPSLGALRNLLINPEGKPPGHVSLRAYRAVQQIGLRDPDRCMEPAETILLELMNSVSSYSHRRQIALLLGPYGTQSAYDEVTRPIKSRLRSSGNEPTLLLDLADIQLRFQKWEEALKTARSAEKADSKNAFSVEIEIYKAVAHCGEGQFDRVEKALRSSGRDPRTLLETWPVLQKMADNPKYRHLFAEPEEGSGR